MWISFWEFKLWYIQTKECYIVIKKRVMKHFILTYEDLQDMVSEK